MSQVVRRLVLDAEKIVCREEIQGAVGIKGMSTGSEVVLLQGAEEEWFAFASMPETRAESVEPISAEQLNKFVERVEQAYGGGTP